MECLNDFCAISGQVISPAKEKLFLSPNFHKLTAREISARCQIPLTADLGKYLGVPLIHKRVSKTTYYHILEKVQDRLAGWKAEQLSMAGRTLLVQSVTSAIPVYTMQTTRIPEAINQEIDRRNCRFVWGNKDNKKRKQKHLVAWDKVCKAKKEGGLGLRSMSKVNTASMARMGRKILSEPDSLWAAVLKGKYPQNANLL